MIKRPEKEGERKGRKKMANGILEVQLLDARGLKGSDLFNKVDPYVKIQYRDQEKKSNVAKDEGGSPVWNQSFKFRVNFQGRADNQHKLILRIMDHDTFSADDFLGEASIYVCDVIEAGAHSGFAEIKPQKYSVVLPDMRYCGEIRVAVSFTKKVVGGANEELGGWRHSSFT